MTDLMELSNENIKHSFLRHSIDGNIDNLVYTITKDRECSDAYKADLKTWLELLVELK